MKTKIAFGLAAIVGMGMLGACDGGSDGSDGGAGGAASGGTNNGSGGYTEGSGGNNATGGAEGGMGGGGGEMSVDAEVTAFCDKYETDCDFGEAMFFASKAACMSGAADLKAANADRWGCMQDHLDNVTLYDDTVHCTHASGEASPCAAADFN